MTFLELAQKLRQESGIAGTGPTNVTSQNGIEGRIVDWINDAWLDIQSDRENWDWMWVPGATVNTTASQADYAPVADFGLAATALARWEVETMRIFLTSDGRSAERPLQYIPYEDYKEDYLAGEPDDNMPAFFTVLPSGNIRLYPPPNDIYTLTIDYYKQPTKMAADDDVPEMPTWLHDAIWARALLDYAIYDEAITVGQAALRKAELWQNRLDARNRPQISIKGTALA